MQSWHPWCKHLLPSAIQSSLWVPEYILCLSINMNFNLFQVQLAAVSLFFASPNVCTELPPYWLNKWLKNSFFAYLSSREMCGIQGYSRFGILGKLVNSSPPNQTVHQRTIRHSWVYTYTCSCSCVQREGIGERLGHSPQTASQKPRLPRPNL